MMRTVKSYMRRQGRITLGQAQALAQFWQHYGIDCTPDGIATLAAFTQSAPLVVEIGFGMGDSLLALAKAHPERRFLGIEVHRPGIGALFLQLEQQQIDNVRVICADAVNVLTILPDASIDLLLLWFPDPWPKKRHHKRRLVQLNFVDLVVRKLKLGGHWHLATDWSDYAAHMLNVLTISPKLSNIYGDGQYAPKPDYRPTTKFESRGKKLGHNIYDLIFIRKE